MNESTNEFYMSHDSRIIHLWELHCCQRACHRSSFDADKSIERCITVTPLSATDTDLYSECSHRSRRMSDNAGPWYYVLRCSVHTTHMPAITEENGNSGSLVSQDAWKSSKNQTKRLMSKIGIKNNFYLQKSWALTSPVTGHWGTRALSTFNDIIFFSSLRSQKIYNCRIHLVPYPSTAKST